MSYIDCITIAAQHAQDWNLPVNLWPTFIENEALNLCVRDSDTLPNPDWN